ncbi:MAG: serine/threonine-protein kinase [Polyangiaceae bacterium]
MPGDFPIESRFTLEERIGRGVSGDVHRGRDRATGAFVAITRVTPAGAPLPIDRFRRDARLFALINDPNVVRYVAHGVDSMGRLCLVVEWLEGEDVAQRTRRRRLTVAEALDVGRQAARGLAALHRVGIVHGDVRPANLFLVGSGARIHVKVLDPGVARPAQAATPEPALAPYYASPEQARREERLTPRADQFALASVVFELLSGRRAFPGDDAKAVLAKIALAEPPRLRDVVPGAPPELCALLARAMSKPQDCRFGSMVEMADALGAVGPWAPLEEPTIDEEPGEG